MCLYNEKKYNESIAAFREAGKTQRSRRIANQWVSVIESDLERNRQIQLAENAAQKQLRDLRQRLAAAERI